MYSAFNPDCGFDNSTIILIGDMYWPNTKCLNKHCLHKKTFESLGKSNYQCPQCRSVCQVLNILLKIKQIPLLVAWSRVYIFEASPKSFQDVIGDVYCLGKYCSSIEKCESLGGFVTTPGSIYACGKCGAWLFVHKFLFLLQEHLMSTKRDKTRFLFARKRWTCYSTNNYCLMSLFNQPKV